jgi:hypothetical protein
MVVKSCCAARFAGVPKVPHAHLDEAYLRLKKRQSFPRDSQRLDQLRPVTPNVSDSLVHGPHAQHVFWQGAE